MGTAEIQDNHAKNTRRVEYNQIPSSFNGA